MTSVIPGIGTSGRERASDRALVSMTRAGDIDAFSELWRRHRSAAIGVAHLFTASSDPEDLVSEAYAVILGAIRRGGGPTGDAFRSYLYTTVRNLARRWGSGRHEIAVEELPEEAGDDDDAVVLEQLGALDRGLVRAAFDHLPERWREILWYTEVEGMSPAAAAPLLGLSANATAALSCRAREGLRQAWLQMHVADSPHEGECGWALAHIGEHSRDGLGKRAGARIDAHLAACRPCRDVALEVGQVSRQLARILLPAALGAGPAAAWLLAPAPPAMAATAAGAMGVGAQLLGVVAAAAAAAVLLTGAGGIPSSGTPPQAHPIGAAASQPAAAAESALDLGRTSFEWPPPIDTSVANTVVDLPGRVLEPSAVRPVLDAVAAFAGRTVEGAPGAAARSAAELLRVDPSVSLDSAGVGRPRRSRGRTARSHWTPHRARRRRSDRNRIFRRTRVIVRASRALPCNRPRITDAGRQIINGRNTAVGAGALALAAFLIAAPAIARAAEGDPQSFAEGRFLSGTLGGDDLSAVVAVDRPRRRTTAARPSRRSATRSP